VQSNNPNSYYHINWDVYAKRVECPIHLTEVTGCKLQSTNLPQANPNVTTAAQAKADSTFLSGYTTTTMQDCCKPTCAWKDNVSQAGTPVGNYDSFYSCDQNGAPVTDPQ
jgi:transcription elongation factor